MAVPDRSYQVLTTAIILSFFQLLVTALWLCTRRISKIGFMWADVFTPAGLISILGMYSCILLLLRYDIGKHADALTTEQLTVDAKIYALVIYYAMPPLYLCAATFPKFSILDLYMHIFIDRPSRYAVYIIGAILSLSWMVNLVTIMTQCTPFDHPWTGTPGGHCEDIRAHFAYGILPNIVTDVALLALPIPMILRLHAIWQKKLAIMLVFLFGSLGLVTSAMCFAMFLRSPTFFSLKEFKAHDATWYLSTPMVWCLIEPGVYYITSCLMMLGPLYKWAYSSRSVRSLLSRPRKDSSGSILPTHPQATHIADRSLQNRGSDSIRENSSTVFAPGANGFAQCFADADQENRKFNHMERCILVEHGFEATES